MKSLLTKFICIVFITILSSNTFAGSIKNNDFSLNDIDTQDRYLAMAEQKSFNEKISRASREDVLDDAFDLMEEANQE